MSIPVCWTSSYRHTYFWKKNHIRLPKNQRQQRSPQAYRNCSVDSEKPQNEYQIVSVWLYLVGRSIKTEISNRNRCSIFNVVCFIFKVKYICLTSCVLSAVWALFLGASVAFQEFMNDLNNWMCASNVAKQLLHLDVLKFNCYYFRLVITFHVIDHSIDIIQIIDSCVCVPAVSIKSIYAPWMAR